MPLQSLLMASVKIIPAMVSALALGALLTLSSCTTTPKPAGEFAQDASDEGRLFGDYLAGTYANHLDDAKARSESFSRAFALNPQDKFVARRAVTSALTAGDFALAVNLSQEVKKSGNIEPMAHAILGADHLAKARYARALEDFGIETPELTTTILMGIMQGWSQHALGDPAAARISFSQLPGGGYFARLGLLQLAEMETALGNFDAAKTALDDLEAQGPQTLNLEMTLARARLKSARGDLTEALTFLEGFSKDNGTFETGPVPDYIARLKSGSPIHEAFAPQQLAARGLTQPAIGFFGANQAWDVSEVFLRAAMQLDPSYAKPRVWTGDIIAFKKRHPEAVALYRSIPKGDPYYVTARLSEGQLHLRNEDDDKALKVFEALYASNPSYVTRNALGTYYLSKENYVDALPIYEAVVKGLTEEELKENPRALYLRGIAYERTKNWPAAVADFERVLAYKPDHADALNYLGYTWVDRGENLTRAFEMIRKAVELEPQSGAIVDSLGWAHYKLGQYEQARLKLEDAVALTPSSATIIDHLGDVYYKLGRKREAEYQWSRALDYDPTDEERSMIARKLSSGLSAAQAAP